ncbi:hypothetical protein ACFS27_04305 [Promicromonospora vindobonensis]|uniref:Secreted protein n=1 Tax=Promicromonospora vindobonensis TaxID=195748 RepID=A0ABW5VMD2_9MICO
MRRSRLVQGWAVILVMLVGGCAQPGAAGGTPDAGTSGEPGGYLCHGTPVPAEVLADGATADELGDEAAAALDGASVPGIEPEQWRVLTETSTQVYLIRELPEPRDSDGEQRTHELLGIEWTDQTEDGGEGWHLVEQEDRIELGIGVEAPPGDDQNCPSNPPTPFTIELDEPLGDRTLMDVAVYPERELAVIAQD